MIIVLLLQLHLQEKRYYYSREVYVTKWMCATLSGYALF